MFQSYTFKHIKYLGKKDDKYSWEYELTDSDFGTISGVCGGVEVWGGVAVIQEYSKRNLNVAKNLMLFFIWHNKFNKMTNFVLLGNVDKKEKNM